MKDHPPDGFAPVLFGLAAAYVLIAVIGHRSLFVRSKDAAFKRRWHPWYVAFVIAFIVASTFIMCSMGPAARGRDGLPRRYFLLIGACTALGAFLESRRALFCDSCGTTIRYAGRRIVTIEGAPRAWTHCCACGWEMEQVPIRAIPFWALSLQRYRRRSICPECGLRYPENLLYRRFRPHHCPECGADLARGPGAARRNSGHGDLGGTDWDFGPDGPPPLAQEKDRHDAPLDT